MRVLPSLAAPPACSTMNAIGSASYMSLRRPSLYLTSRGYMKMPPRVSIRYTSATIEAIQRMLKSLPRSPVFPARHSSM